LTANACVPLGNQFADVHQDGLLPYDASSADMVTFRHGSPALSRVLQLVEKLRNAEAQIKYENLTRTIREHFINTRPGAVELRLKDYLLRHIERVVQDAFCNAEVTPQIRLFGSSACGLDSKGGDIDVGILYTRENNVKTLRKVLMELHKHRAQNLNGEAYKLKIQPIFHCKVPILKIKDNSYDLQADLSIWRGQGVVSDLIMQFIQYDKRVQPFLIAIKYWSKRRRINDASQNMINSFGYVILALKFLQMLGIIPIRPTTDEPIARKEIPVNLGDILVGFFDFYANFPFDSHQISILKEGIQLKNPSEFDVREIQTVMILQDPIEISNNVARNVREGTLRQIQSEFKRSYQCLSGDGGWIKATEKIEKRSKKRKR